jgi:PIN domain nuclease of toxin-antitoxin system
LEGDLSIAYLDTQIAVWLHDGFENYLTKEANRQVESSTLLISPMVLLEFQYLFDRKTLRIDPTAIYMYLNATFGVDLCSFPFPAIAMEALTCDWTRDPFDRIIVSHAKANDEAPLITADRKIRQNYANAIW